MSTTSLPAVRYGAGEIAEMAKTVARSKLFGMDESQMFTLMLLAESKGLHPIQAVERYHVIQGRPAMKADAMLAEFQRGGGTVEWGQHDHLKCEGVFSGPGVKTPVAVSWSIEDAKRAQLTNNPMYTKYPRQMLRARVISEGIRMTMPGIICGIYTTEEAEDIVTVGASLSRPGRPEHTTGVRESFVDAEVIGRQGIGFDDRPYHQVVSDAVKALNAAMERAAEEAGCDWSEVKPVEVHKHLTHAAVNLGYADGPPPTSSKPAIEAMTRVYKAQRDWVRSAITAYLRDLEAKATEVLQAAVESRRPADDGEAREDDPADDIETTEAGARG